MTEGIKDVQNAAKCLILVLTALVYNWQSYEREEKSNSGSICVLMSPLGSKLSVLAGEKKALIQI